MLISHARAASFTQLQDAAKAASVAVVEDLPLWQQTQELINSFFVSRFDDFKHSNLLGRCTFPDCKREIIRICNSADCLTNENVGVLAKHMNVAYGSDLGMSP
jgi:hypothetical protein